MLIVNVFVVNHVLKKVYVQIVNRKGRMKMEKNKSQESKKQELKASLKTVRKSSSQAERNEKRRLALRFSPTAWAKLLYFRDKSDNEVGGFGITDPDDLLFVKEFVTIKQEATVVSVKFDDMAVAGSLEKAEDTKYKWKLEYRGDGIQAMTDYSEICLTNITLTPDILDKMNDAIMQSGQPDSPRNRVFSIDIRTKRADRSKWSKSVRPHIYYSPDGVLKLIGIEREG